MQSNNGNGCCLQKSEEKIPFVAEHFKRVINI